MFKRYLSHAVSMSNEELSRHVYISIHEDSELFAMIHDGKYCYDIEVDGDYVIIRDQVIPSITQYAGTLTGHVDKNADNADKKDVLSFVKRIQDLVQESRGRHVSDTV